MSLPEGLLPPWKYWPELPWGSAGWRMGQGEQHMQAWLRQFRAMSDGQRAAYRAEWPEVEDWKGFYLTVETGAPPPWVTEEAGRVSAAALPPRPGEDRISERYRVKWLATQHFSRLKRGLRDPDDQTLNELYVDAEGWVWKLVLSAGTSGSFAPPHFVRHRGRLIGPDNVAVEQPVT